MRPPWRAGPEALDWVSDEGLRARCKSLVPDWFWGCDGSEGETCGDAYDRGYKQAAEDWAARCNAAEQAIPEAHTEGFILGVRAAVQSIRDHEDLSTLSKTLEWLESPAGMAALNPKTKPR